MANWKVLVPDFFEKYWNEYDTYGSEELARDQFEREERAKLVKVEKTTVDQKGKLQFNRTKDTSHA